MHSGDEVDSGVEGLDHLVPYEELGLGNDFVFHPSEFDNSEELMLSSTMTLSDLEANLFMEPPAEENQQITELQSINPQIVAATNQPTEAANGKVGKVRGRGKPKDEFAEVLRVRAPRKLKHRVSQHVPEEKKTVEYFEHRRKNTEAARKCREKKRVVDEKRVEIIKRQVSRIEELEGQVARLTHENELYKGMISNFGKTVALP